MISVSYFDGDDLVTEVHTDNSSLVNAAGILGVGDVMPMLAGGIIGGGVATEMNKEMHSGWDDSDWEEWEGDEWTDEEMDADDDDDAY